MKNDRVKEYQEQGEQHLDSLVTLVNNHHQKHTEAYEHEQKMMTKMMETQQQTRQVCYLRDSLGSMITSEFGISINQN